jgi:hypothetical protein
MVGFTCIETQIVASATKGALSAGFVPVIAAFVAALVLSIGANMIGLRKLA